MLVFTGSVFENSSLFSKNTTQYQEPHHIIDLCETTVEALCSSPSSERALPPSEAKVLDTDTDQMI